MNRNMKEKINTLIFIKTELNYSCKEIHVLCVHKIGAYNIER